MKNFYISTPIFYPNGDLHLGHLYSMTIAWSLKNYKKLRGYKTLLVTGADEHGLKIALSAKKLNLDPQSFVDVQSNKFKDFWQKYHIDYDIFVRTSEQRHFECIQKILEKLKEKDFIYKDFYEGLYSIQDEEFFTKIQANKIDNKYYHPTSNHELSLVKEESYFLKLDEFQNWLVNYLKNNHNFIMPIKTIHELENSFLNQKLENLSISRTSFDWGIPFPFDSKHITYVWIDALFSYLSPLNLFTNNDNLYQEFWNNDKSEKIHIVGKEITRFHGIYWPIMLKMLDIKQPNTILSHGWLITPTGKMSKSKGNVIDPVKLLDNHNFEVVKLFLIFSFNIYRDNIFDEVNINLFYNAYLANNFGNLLARVSSMYEQNFKEKIKFDKTNLFIEDKEILEKILEIKKSFELNFDQFFIDKAMENVFELGNLLNLYIDKTKAWLLKNDKNRLATVLLVLLNGIYAMTTFLQVAMPETMEKVRKVLKQKELNLENISNWNKFDDSLIEKIDSFFPRIK